MSKWTDVLDLIKGDRFVYDQRVYKAHSVDSNRGKVYIETTTGTLITVPVGEGVEVL